MKSCYLSQTQKDLENMEIKILKENVRLHWFLSIALRKYSVRDSFVNIFNHLNLTKEARLRSKGYDQLIDVHLNENS